MTTKAESDTELAAELTAIQADQDAEFAANAKYTFRATVAGASSVAVHEYYGGPEGCGWMTIQSGDDGGGNHRRITDHGDGGRTTGWIEIDE